MNVVFGLDFDGGSWPGPLAGRAAVAGEIWVGPAGLLDLLETRLGIGEAAVPACVRAAALAPAIRRTEGFWSASAEVDALGTARRLISWRDALRLHGWRGEPVSERLAALARATAAARPGRPDRLDGIADALSRRGAGIGRVELVDPIDTLPALWRAALDGLASRGTSVVERRLVPSGGAGADLAAARATAFAPRGDGSLQLVRPEGPLAAAEETAAWLEGSGTLDRSVVIGGETVLDRALRRHGLPTTGALGATSDEALLQVLPLSLALAARTPDPTRVLELLTLSRSPVPRPIAFRLAAALRQWPAVGSEEWRDALAAGLAVLPETERADVAARLDALFAPADARQAIPIAAILSRLDAIERWLGPRRPDRDGAGDWAGARRQCALVRRLLSLLELREIARPEVARIVEAATEEVGGTPTFVAEAGLASVRWPGAVAGRAGRVIWWSFARDAADTMPPIPLTRDERDGLARLGIRVPARADVLRALAPRRRRPLEQARTALLLVCPRHAATGEDIVPHPLWDEIVARLARSEDAFLLETAFARASPPLARVEAAWRPLPVPRRAWRIPPGTIARPERESAASVGELLGCPFKWVAERVARLRDGLARSLPSGPLLFGLVAHEVLARMLKAVPATGEEAERLALEVFDQVGPRLGAALFQPGMEEHCAEVRLRTARAARVIAETIPSGRRAPRDVERTLAGELLGGRFEGRLDLVLADPPAVVDFKWGRLRDRRRELARGTAHQLAAYASLLSEGGGAPPAGAYFILESQRLLALDRAALPSAEVVRGPSHAETWRAAERAVERRRGELARGEVTAPGNADAAGRVEPKEDALAGGVLVLAAPCTYCRFGALCGRAFGDAP